MTTSTPLAGEVFIEDGNVATLQENGDYLIKGFDGLNYRLKAGDDYEVNGKTHTRYSLRRVIGEGSEVPIWISGHPKGEVPTALLSGISGSGLK